MIITGLILKENIIPKGRTMEIHVDDNIYTKGSINSSREKIASIRHHTKKSAFAGKHDMTIGVYCVKFVDSDQYYVIPENSVAFTMHNG